MPEATPGQSTSSLDRMRAQIKAGVHPRDALIDSYRDEWIENPASARARMRKWRGTDTGMAIEEGCARRGHDWGPLHESAFGVADEHRVCRGCGVVAYD